MAALGKLDFFKKMAGQVFFTAIFVYLKQKTQVTYASRTHSNYFAKKRLLHRSFNPVKKFYHLVIGISYVMMVVHYRAGS
jgi:hypothetical protein